jgi:hypothetical protein
MAHLACCRLFGVPVARVCYFRLGQPAGYVLHAPPRHAWQHVLIGLGPFLFNSSLAVACALCPRWHVGSAYGRWPVWLCVWLSLAIGLHAFPSTGDARAIWGRAWSRGTPLWLRLLAIPLVALLYLLAWGSVLWLDLAYALFLTIVVPRWLVAAWGG